MQWSQIPGLGGTKAKAKARAEKSRSTLRSAPKTRKFQTTPTPTATKGQGLSLRTAQCSATTAASVATKLLNAGYGSGPRKSVPKRVIRKRPLNQRQL